MKGRNLRGDTQVAEQMLSLTATLLTLAPPGQSALVPKPMGMTTAWPKKECPRSGEASQLSVVRALEKPTVCSTLTNDYVPDDHHLD